MPFVACYTSFSFIRIQDINESEANFTVARAHCQSFAFVHVAHAQFEHSQGRERWAFCFCTPIHILMTQYLGYFSVCYISSYQATQREAFTSCRMLLKWVPNQRNCWRQPYKKCKQGRRPCYVRRIRKMYHVSIYSCLHESTEDLHSLLLQCKISIWYINF